MTREDAKTLIPILTAYANGEAVEIKEFNGWRELKDPAFNANIDRYRIKPKPVTRPWSKPEDVPGPVLWIRGKQGSGINDVQRLVVCVHEDVKTVSYAPGGAAHIVTFEELAKQWEHSTDRKTWHPCTVTEAA